MSPNSSETPSDASVSLVKFKGLFEKARQAHSQFGKNAMSDVPAHQAALSYAQTHNIPGGVELLECLADVRVESQLEHALAKIAAIKVRLPQELKGYADYVQGLLLRFLKRSDEAIECFQKAICMPGFSIPGVAYNNMGFAFAVKGEHDRAIECYQKALGTVSYTTRGDAHNNMGIAYADKGEHKRAIECYKEALAIGGYDTPHHTRNNLAISLRDICRYEDALAEVDRVLQEPDSEGQHKRARIIQSQIKDAQAGVKPTLGEEALVNVESATAEDGFENQILKKLGAGTHGQRDKYGSYLRKDDSKRDNVFSCLRGWSSAVTLLEGGSNSHWQGGGYFFKWKGKGFVLDPGFDFIDNFHDAGFIMREVDAVLVSHNHPDHNYDLLSLDDLRYELHRRWPAYLAESKQAGDVPPCLFAMDEDTAKSFPSREAKHRGPPLKFTAFDSKDQKGKSNINGLPFTLKHFLVSHGKDVPGAVGMKLVFHDSENNTDLTVGYTGDTEYWDGLSVELQDCDILLAHISMPGEEELDDYEKKKEAGDFKRLTSEGYKRNHLGYRGLIKLVQETQPKMVLVGEFWAGLEDIRIDLIRGIRHQVKTALGREIPILPTGIGFHLQLPTLNVECTACRKYTPHERIKVAPATSPFGPLGYLCPGCLI